MLPQVGFTVADIINYLFETVQIYVKSSLAPRLDNGFKILYLNDSSQTQLKRRNLDRFPHFNLQKKWPINSNILCLGIFIFMSGGMKIMESLITSYMSDSFAMMSSWFFGCIIGCFLGAVGMEYFSNKWFYVSSFTKQYHWN